jgi:hypothetical protein
MLLLSPDCKINTPHGHRQRSTTATVVAQVRGSAAIMMKPWSDRVGIVSHSESALHIAEHRITSAEKISLSLQWISSDVNRFQNLF